MRRGAQSRGSLALAIALAAMPLTTARSQVPVDSTLHGSHGGPGVFAGEDREECLRTLQLLGAVPLHQLSVRALGPRELESLVLSDSGAQPHAPLYDWCANASGTSSNGPRHAALLPAEASTSFNSTHAFGINDGPVWQGRGLTVSARAGAYARLGPVSLVLAPVAFVSQNAEFPLEPNGQVGTRRFADAIYPDFIDHPQRFGDAAYGRIDFGESTLRVDALGAAAGISSASQWWGPMTRYPYLLSNNAGGFPHVFLGTSAPANVWIGRLHARLIYGQLAQTDYSPIQTGEGRRFASGIVAVFQPRGLTGLELGGARFFASPWPSDGIASSQLGQPFGRLLKTRGDGSIPDDPQNQLASVFGRLVHPGSGVEVYGEYGREDHNADLRDFWLEPDHASVYGMGLRRAWWSDGTTASVFAAELVNTRISHLVRVRSQSAPYVHTPIAQGHTHRGQPLGMGTGARAGEALTMSLTRYRTGGTSLLRLSRHGDEPIEGAPRVIRVILEAEHGVTRGPVEVIGGIGLAHRIGRREMRGGTNLSLSLGTRWRPAGPLRGTGTGITGGRTAPH